MVPTCAHAEEGPTPEMRIFERVEEWTPYVTLAFSTLVAMLSGPQTVRDRALTLAFVALAGGWVMVAYTRAPAERRARRGPMAVYFVGLLVVAALVMSRDPIFFVFALTGFFHAAVLRPLPLVFVGVFASSVVMHVVAFLPSDPDGGAVFGIATIIVIQTLAIGFGIVGSLRLEELSEQRRDAVLEMQATLEENAGLHAQLVTQAREAGVHDERERMAREIHDTLAQGLTGVITQLEAARREDTTPAARTRHLDNAAALARQSLTEARRSVHALGPEPLDDRRLPEALDDVVARWSQVNDVKADLATTGSPQQLHPEVETTLLRVVQEALANVAKHAEASRVGVTLSFMDDLVAVDVRDDGRGFDVSSGHGPTDGTSPDRGFGLTAMRQRIDRLAGRFEVESEPGVGTAVSASVPAVGPPTEQVR